MIKCGKSCLPECEYFTTGGCISPFNCPYKIEYVSITTATSTPLNSNVVYTDETCKDKQITRLTTELEKYKRALSKVIKDRNVLAKEFYGTIVQGEGQLYEDYYLGWVEHEMQEERK